ncbi:MAG TPA: hypothetical protein EYP32_03015 [Aquificaceae bacterium]|nr:hypothetical protein [Aquificaceae bacterium]
MHNRWAHIWHASTTADWVPKEFWTKFSLLLLTHGKTICKAKNPQCDKCVIRDLCAYGSGTND